LSSETLDSKDIEEIISFNKQKVEEREEGFEVDKKLLSKIFVKMNSYNHIQDRRERIVRKASCILAGITFHQPFFEGNKETALGVTVLYLNRNGFDLALEDKQIMDEIYDILTKTLREFSIFGEVELYLLKRVSLFYQ
jgi:prophage maintenance system killer protein